MKKINNQSGAILVISLLILLILTVIGVAGMKTTITEEKMAGNNRERELAFQSAEAALAIGENETKRRASNATWLASLLEQSNVTPCDNNSLSGDYKGTCGQYAPDVDPFEMTWANANSISADTTLTVDEAATVNLSSGDSNLNAPKFFIQLVRYDSVDRAYIFKITARGVGGDEKAMVFLQSTYSVGEP